MTAKRCVDLVNQKRNSVVFMEIVRIVVDLYGVNIKLRSILQTRGVDYGSKNSESAPIPQLAPSVAPTSPYPSSSVSIPPLSPHAAVVSPVVEIPSQPDKMLVEALATLAFLNEAASI